MVSAVAVAVLAVQAFDAARRPSVVREQEPGRHARAHGGEASGESLAEAPNASPEALTSAGVDSPESRMQKAKMAITSSSSPQMIH